MSKKSKERAVERASLKEQESKERQEARDRFQAERKAAEKRAKQAGGSKPVKKAAHPKSGSGVGARVYQPPAVGSRNGRVNPMQLRITASIMAVVSLAAAIYLIISLNGQYTGVEIGGMIALGFIAGLSALVAFRPEEVAKRINEQRARRS